MAHHVDCGTALGRFRSEAEVGLTKRIYEYTRLGNGGPREASEKRKINRCARTKFLPESICKYAKPPSLTDHLETDPGSRCLSSGAGSTYQDMKRVKRFTSRINCVSGRVNS